MNNKPVVELKGVSVIINNEKILDHINLSIGDDEQWAIIGPSGSGKTTLAQAITGRIFHSGTIDINFPGNPGESKHLMLVEQQHRFRTITNTNDFYYQQRFNSQDASLAITVEEALNDFRSTSITEIQQRKWLDLLDLAPLLQKPLIQLSNGENKRLQIAEVLFDQPAMVVLDNPFTGLDKAGREKLHQIIGAMSAAGTRIILVANAKELPSCITHVALLEEGRLIQKGKKEDIQWARTPASLLTKTITSPIPAGPDLQAAHFTNAIRMVNVTIKYGDKTVLDSINWKVAKGECWSITGPNGAGKSTLLSLVTADNPQAYANEIYLFDKRRGRGESIWDIKQLIGYVSPELHLFFEAHSNCFDVIASGLFDTIGLFRQLNEEQKEQIEYWVKLMQLEKYRLHPLFRLSLGQQRMVLLARALVKNPPLLILDEPCQGLDESQAEYFRELINELCTRFSKTLLYVSHYERDIPSCVSHSLRFVNGRQVVASS